MFLECYMKWLLNYVNWSEPNIFLQENSCSPAVYRAWQINEINGINDINQINDGLINLCKLGLVLMRINDGLIRINDKK